MIRVRVLTIGATRKELDGWMCGQGDQQTVYGKPLRLSEPVTEIVRPAKKAINQLIDGFDTSLTI